MSKGMIECPSCGELCFIGGSCESCASWREANDAKIASLLDRVAELEGVLKVLPLDHLSYCSFDPNSDRADAEYCTCARKERRLLVQKALPSSGKDEK